MEMLWQSCPRCSGAPPLMQAETPGPSDATQVLVPAVAVPMPRVPQSAEPLTWALVVTGGILPGARIELQGKGVRVGRSPSRAGGQEPLLQPDTHLSRDHFAVVPEGDGWAVHDLGSSNGTQVNGEKVNRRTLKAGDEIRAGHTTFRVEEHSRGDGG